MHDHSLCSETSVYSFCNSFISRSDEWDEKTTVPLLSITEVPLIRHGAAVLPAAGRGRD